MENQENQQISDPKNPKRKGCFTKWLFLLLLLAGLISAATVVYLKSKNDLSEYAPDVDPTPIMLAQTPTPHFSLGGYTL